MTTIVSGAVSTVTDLGKDEAWMASWLRDEPARLGLGDLNVTEDAADADERSFVALDDDRCFSVDVQLGEMEASRGFGVLDNWARNRVRHPDKTHVAVLVTELISDRYQTTLATLAEHLPLVVVELQVWKGQDEAIVVPHLALASDDVDLSQTAAARAAEALARTGAGASDATSEGEVGDTVVGDPEVVSEAEAVAAEADAQAGADAETDDDARENKDDTGVGNPWGLTDDQDEEDTFQASGSGSTSLLSKVS